MMKKFPFLLLILASCAGSPPGNLGPQEGRLLPCPETPNCISTQAEPRDEIHYAPPLPFDLPLEVLQNAIKDILKDLPRNNLIEEKPGYLYYTFRSSLMGFVDDVEFLLDEKEGLLHFRSASRLGVGDMGVNRKRYENIYEKIKIFLEETNEQ